MVGFYTSARLLMFWAVLFMTGAFASSLFMAIGAVARSQAIASALQVWAGGRAGGRQTLRRRAVNLRHSTKKKKKKLKTAAAVPPGRPLRPRHSHALPSTVPDAVPRTVPDAVPSAVPRAVSDGVSVSDGVQYQMQYPPVPAARSPLRSSSSSPPAASRSTPTTSPAAGSVGPA